MYYNSIIMHSFEILPHTADLRLKVSGDSLEELFSAAMEAYKNVDEVVDVVHSAGLAKKVARMRPIAVIKG